LSRLYFWEATAVNNLDPDTFIEDFNEDDYYRAIVANDPAKAGDLQGWLDRVNAIDTFQSEYLLAHAAGYFGQG
jgi:hypothetical protein